MWETWVRSLGWEDLLEEGKATHSSILAWRVPMDRGLAGYGPGICKELGMTEQLSIQFSSVQSLSRIRLFVTLWIAARQASLSITNSWSLLKLMPIESVMPSSHLILCSTAIKRSQWMNSQAVVVNLTLSALTFNRCHWHVLPWSAVNKYILRSTEFWIICFTNWLLWQVLLSIYSVSGMLPALRLLWCLKLCAPGKYLREPSSSAIHLMLMLL